MNNEMKKNCWFVDLTHTAQGIHSRYFPLGVGLVAEYTKEVLSEYLKVEVYKFPEELEKQAQLVKPEIVCLSNYAWNLELSYTFIKAYKELNNDAIIVMGGPNFSTLENEVKPFFDRYPLIDFYIFSEGELAFVNLMKVLIKNDYDTNFVKKQNIRMFNCTYVYDDNVVVGDTERILDISILPSPYLKQSFDKYFDMNLIPLYETTRGCPYGCTFCADGISSKNKVRRYPQNIIDENLEYIAKKSGKVDTLTMADLNFGMYHDDINTAKTMAKLKKEYNYPSVINVAAGKSKFDNVLKTITVLDGSWTVGSSVQSTDEEVLKNIKRKNLPSSKMPILAKLTESNGSESFSEVILALPTDTKEKHYNSLKTATDAGVNSLRMYQLMLLSGTEMSSQESRKKYRMNPKYRVMPGCSGQYDFFDKTYNVAEFEEVVVSNSTLSYDDYIECRIMNLFIEIFINGSMFNELFRVLDYYNISRFDCILRIKERSEVFNDDIKNIVESFIFDTKKELFETYEEAKNYINRDGTIAKHISGESGNNEMLDHKVRAYLKYREFAELLFNEIIFMLKEQEIVDEIVELFVHETKEFMILKKRDFRMSNNAENTYFSFDFSLDNVDTQLKSFDRGGYYYSIYHTDEQQVMIANLLTVFSTKNIMGLGRLIQKTNMKLLYRKFDVISEKITAC